MDKLNEEERITGREKLWDWMIKSNGEQKWFSMRAEIVQVIKQEALKIRAKKGYATYADLPDRVKLRAIDLMYYPEDVKRIIHEK